MSDLQELFNRLKAQPPSESPARPQSSGNPSIWYAPTYQQPSVSSPLFSPPSHTPNPLHSSNIISPVNPSSTVASPPPDRNRTNNLLNLLKFNNQGSQAGPMANLQNVGGLRTSSMGLTGEGNDGNQARPMSAQDLMASFQRKSSSQNVPASSITTAGADKPEITSRPSSDSKDFLLNLLTRPNAASKPLTVDAPSDNVSLAETKQDEAAVDKLAQSFAEASLMPPIQTQPPPRQSTPVRQFGSPSAENTPFEAPQSAQAAWSGYVNPFDQLHSSSPLNRSPRPGGSTEAKKFEILKHDRETSSTLNGDSTAPASKHRKVAPDEPSSVGPLAPADPDKSKSVSQALEGVGEKVDKQVEQALAQADAQEKVSATSKSVPAETGDNVAEDGTVIKKESPGNDDEVESNWESAEDQEVEKSEDFNVEVYNFPMKPFVSIHVQSTDTPRPIRQSNFMVIAQFKKEFDQVDRSLATASQTYIVYAHTATKKENAGFRVLRQDTGTTKQVFRSSGERIFSVQICSSAIAGNDVETVLATGVQGTVYWTSLSKSRGELFVDDDLEAQGFIMPMVPTPEEQASGTQVKTRSKKSSRHPDYFAVSRGKLIHIIAPDAVKGKQYLNAKTHKVNSEKFLAEHGLRIMTGKACKDFCFSEDDTMIASLDKSGRFKFWDIKDLTSRASDITEGKHDPVELRDPIWELSAASSGSKPDEKPSVSSIMFLDKDRPMSRGIALRYMLIGFKQNHILQLWDLGLGKAVQEIRLPHEKDSDAICSVSYHPRTGIIAVGHPTRNSIYFVHLSAPRYSISHMDQAKYINLLARGDPSLPRPESTAIMSGLREFTFAKVGELRSVDMLAQPVENTTDPNGDDPTLFELYVMHSKGVVGMSVKRKDMGWDKDSKMINPIDAIQAGVIEVKELIPPQRLSAPSEQSSNADTSAKQISKPAVPKKHEPPKASAPASSKTETIKREAPSSPAATATASAPKILASKQVPEAPLASQQAATNPPLMTAESYAMAAQRAKSPERDGKSAHKKTVSSSTDTAPAPQVSSNGDLQAMLNKQFDALYQRIDTDKRVHDAAGSAKQDAVLRLVSSTLTDNVESSLNRIVSENMAKEIVPSITNNINKTIEKKLSETLPQQLSSHVSKEVKASLPHAIQQALKDPHVHNAIANQVAQKVQQQVSQLLQQSMPNLATQATQKMVADLDSRTQQQLREAESQRQKDNINIQELSAIVEGLSSMIQNMSESQVAFQEQILKMQRPSSRTGVPVESIKDAASATSASASAAEPQKSPEEMEVDKITQMLMRGEYDSATIAWLQSPHQPTIFDKVFVRVNPRYLEKVTPLIALSVSAAVTSSLDSHVHQRLEWLGVVLDNIDLQDADIKEVAPKIMDVLSSRLQAAYMVLSEANSAEPALKRISALNRRVGEVRRLAA